MLRSLSDPHTPHTLGASATARRPWISPALVQLPPLEQLTLQTGGIGGSCTPGTGCTFSFLSVVDRGVTEV